ncbi:MAG: hypothetical protein RJB62_1356 [Pseudomonadota bacterium]|jgi:F-type H+-transporting ATPase subunit b
MEAFLTNPHNWVSIGVCIFFGLLIWKKVPQAIAGMLDARAATISKELNDARLLREEAAALLAEYKKKQSLAESEAATIVEEAKAEAQRFTAEAQKALELQIERRGKVAEAKIAQAESQAIAEVRAMAADVAIAAAEKLIAERMNDARSADLIKTALREIPSKLN